MTWTKHGIQCLLSHFNKQRSMSCWNYSPKRSCMQGSTICNVISRNHYKTTSKLIHVCIQRRDQKVQRCPVFTDTSGGARGAQCTSARPNDLIKWAASLAKSVWLRDKLTYICELKECKSSHEGGLNHIEPYWTILNHIERYWTILNLVILCLCSAPAPSRHHDLAFHRTKSQCSCDRWRKLVNSLHTCFELRVLVYFTKLHCRLPRSKLLKSQGRHQPAY